VLLLATEIWRSHGGVQRYTQMLATSLSSAEAFTALSLLDSEDDRPSDAVWNVVCCSGSKRKFCLEALRMASRSSANTCIVGHVALLPVAWALKRLKLIDHYVVVLHGIEAWKTLPWLSRFAARKAAIAVATTAYTAREFCFYNRVERAKCAVIPLACSFRMSANHPRNVTPELKVLTIGRLSTQDRYKGIDTVLQAIFRSRAQGVNVTLDLVGDGNDRKRLEDLARSLGLQGAVRFRGSVSDAELERALRESHVFAMPSKKEGFGIVYLEAMAAGLPCIGANHGGTPEVIEHGESGFLIEYGDVDQFAFFLRALQASPALYAAMSNAALRRATEILTLDRMTQSWHNLLRDLGPPPLEDQVVGIEHQPTNVSGI